MDQIINYISALDWANNWLMYIIASILILWIAILTVKLIINKLIYIVKKTFILALILIVGSVLSYVLFLIGIINFDILTLIGLGNISILIQEFFTNLQEWFKNTFALTVNFIKFLR